MDQCVIPFMVQRSPIVGRCLVASKDLSQGELIVRESPLGKLTTYRKLHKVTQVIVR